MYVQEHGEGNWNVSSGIWSLDWTKSQDSGHGWRGVSMPPTHCLQQFIVTAMYLGCLKPGFCATVCGQSADGLQQL